MSWHDAARPGLRNSSTPKLQPLRDVWKDIYSVLWAEKAAVHPLAFIKFWMDLIGMTGGRVRPPLHDLDDDQKAWLESRLRATGLLERLKSESVLPRAAIA